MTGSESNLTVGGLDRPPGNDLQTNYEKHDIGQEWVIRHLEIMYGLRVEEWGIDMRDAEGDELIFEYDAVDLAVYDGDELLCLFEVKTKSSPGWMGQFNWRHFQNYLILSSEREVPVVLCMCLIDRDYDEVVDYFMGPVDEDMVMETKETFPDGNRRATIRWSHMRTWEWFEQRVLGGVD